MKIITDEDIYFVKVLKWGINEYGECGIYDLDDDDLFHMIIKIDEFDIDIETGQIITFMTPECESVYSETYYEAEEDYYRNVTKLSKKTLNRAQKLYDHYYEIIEGIKQNKIAMFPNKNEKVYFL